MAITTWKELIGDKLTEIGEPLIACTLTDDQLNEKFDNSWGSEEGRAFTAWTENYVLFSVCYDGAEWVGYTYRNPCSEATSHQGGG